LQKCLGDGTSRCDGVRKQKAEGNVQVSNGGKKKVDRRIERLQGETCIVRERQGRHYAHERRIDQKLVGNDEGRSFGC